MENKKKAPAILIFKSMRPMAMKLTRENRGDLFEAILNFSNNLEVPKMDLTAEIAFEVFKQMIDANEQRYLKTCEKNNRYRQKLKQQAQNATPAEPSEAGSEEKPKSRGKPAREPTAEKQGTGAVRQSKLTDLQSRFLTQFKALCPDKAINCKLADFPDVDLEALMIAIKQSPQYLMNPDKTKNLDGLRWYLENADKILNGNYIKFADGTPAKATGKKEDLSEHFKDVEVFGN